MSKPFVTVVGAGLAGSEAAWQLAQRGVRVRLVDMKPAKKSPAHASGLFGELVCSNSLRSDRLSNAVGLLKEELRRSGSLILQAADAARVPAGGALAVDRAAFSSEITRKLQGHPLVDIEEREVTAIPDAPCVIATGPLTADRLAEAIAALPGVGTLNFYDAAAPIVYKDSLNFDKVFAASRYGRGEDYLNCPMDREAYFAFVDALIAAECAEVRGFEDSKVFEGCMPIETMARRGRMTPAFGPLKPVGLIAPKTGKPPFAALQLRRDDAADTLYNLVGFQTRLKFGEQKRVFGLIPGLENAEYARYGVMHRNTFLDSPGLLDATYQMTSCPGLYFAGQMTGVEGYVESAASGLVAGRALARRLLGLSSDPFPTATALGALARYVSHPNRAFEPMNITFGLIDPMEGKFKGKEAKYTAIAERALKALNDFYLDQGD